MAPTRKRTTVTQSWDDIGSAAGDLWSCLDEGGSMLAEEARTKTGLPANVLYAAIGWLAREGKLTLDGGGKTLRISLT